MNIQWQKLSPDDYKQLQSLVSRSNKNSKELLADFNIRRRFACYNHEGEIGLDGFKTFITLYLGAETPEALVSHLFSSFAKKKPDLPQEQEEEAAGPSSETAPEEETPEAAPKADDSELFAPGKGPGPRTFVPEDLDAILPYPGSSEDISERPRSQKREDNGEEVSETESPSKQASKALMSSGGSPPDQGSKKKKSIKLTTRLRKFPFFFFKKRGRSAENADTNKTEGMAETSLIEGGKPRPGDLMIPLEDLARSFSLLESGKPEDKLEFVFRLYDTDGDGFLNEQETEDVVDQMMCVAEHLGWDVTELRPILMNVMKNVDYDKDGVVSLEEWIRGGTTTVPLLVLLGLDSHVWEDGNHLWRVKVFKKPAYCNICLHILVGFGKKGLCCVFCKLTVHERCVERAPNNCITTYSKTKSFGRNMEHHWVEGNCGGSCFRCKKPIRRYKGLNGVRCRWCQTVLHNQCACHVSPMCNLGVNYAHVIPPTAICPIVLDSPDETAEDVEKSAQSSQPTSFRIRSVPGTKPLLVLINPKSGGLQGAEITRQFQYNLNPKQVYSLIQDNPMQALELFKDVKDLRVICCGGDGTVGWILDMIDRSNFATHPTVGVVPLGTGNDLARCLHWGGGYGGEPIPKLLRKMEEATMVMLDRWDIKIVTDSPDGRRPGTVTTTNNVVTNYFSIGVDAAICRKFHTEREKCPEKFNSRIRNKLWYFEFATSETFSASCRDLHLDVEIECDGMPLDLAGGHPLQGITILNIPSTHGGTNLWGDGSCLRGLLSEYKIWLQRLRRGSSEDGMKIDLRKTMQDLGDGLIEVIGLENCLHMGQVRTGLRASGRRLAQCSTLTLRTKKPFPMQIDGEPWMQDPGTITISHRCRVPMLRAPGSQGG